MCQKEGHWLPGGGWAQVTEAAKNETVNKEGLLYQVWSIIVVSDATE